MKKLKIKIIPLLVLASIATIISWTFKIIQFVFDVIHYVRLVLADVELFILTCLLSLTVGIKDDNFFNPITYYNASRLCSKASKGDSRALVKLAALFAKSKNKYIHRYVISLYNNHIKDVYEDSDGYKIKFKTEDE